MRPTGRRDAPGRPLNWATTPRFLAHFGLDSLAELPGIDELRAAGLLDIGPAVLGETSRGDYGRGGARNRRRLSAAGRPQSSANAAKVCPRCRCGGFLR